MFGRDGVRGLANVDISPELAVRLSLAWASTFEKGATVTASRDTSRAARALKRAVMVGCNAAGINVDDLEVATVPVTRFQITSSASQAGMTVRLAPDDPASVVLRFFDEDGLDVDEATQRKIERLYHREDFRRVLAREIGDIGFPPRSLEYYTAALIDSVDLSKPANANLKLVLDYSFGTTSFVMPNLLAKLEAEVLVVNPYANTANVLTFDRLASGRRVAELVVASGAHLGAVLDPGGEYVTMVDDTGRTLSNEEALLVLLTLVTEAKPGGGSPSRSRPAGPRRRSAADRTPRSSGPSCRPRTSWRWRVPKGSTWRPASRAASSSPASCPPSTGRQPWSICWPCSPPLQRRLSDVVATLPPVHIVHHQVHTPWEMKGMVMRTLVERTRGSELVLVDGVKIVETDGWALVLPDPEEPVTHIWVEGPDDAQAEARAQEYVVRLEQLIR